MPRTDLIRVMISSRNHSPILFEGREQNFTAVRRRLMQLIEAETLFGHPLFEVYINEDAPAPGAEEDVWERSLEEVRKADILLVLYSGDAGWTQTGGSVGICHAELLHALATEPAKVRIVEVRRENAGEPSPADRLFQGYVQRMARHAALAASGDEVIDLARGALREAVGALARLGVREARRGRFDTGEALEWSQMDYAARRGAIESALREELMSPGRGGREVRAADGRVGVAVPIARREVLFVCNGVPASMGVAAARELVGRPHLRDHLWAPELAGDVVGPVHLIAGHRSITETQATALLGFPDATIVTPPFGIWVADDVQKVQLVLVKGCRDRTSTLHGVQRFFEWLNQAAGEEKLVERAAARSRIVRALAAEQRPAA